MATDLLARIERKGQTGESSAEDVSARPLAPESESPISIPAPFPISQHPTGMEEYERTLRSRPPCPLSGASGRPPAARTAPGTKSTEHTNLSKRGARLLSRKKEIRLCSAPARWVDSFFPSEGDVKRRSLLGLARDIHHCGTRCGDDGCSWEGTRMACPPFFRFVRQDSSRLLLGFDGVLFRYGLRFFRWLGMPR